MLSDMSSKPAESKETKTTRYNPPEEKQKSPRRIGANRRTANERAVPRTPVPGARESQQQQPKTAVETKVPVAVAVAVSEAGAEAEIPRSSTPQRPFEDRLLEYIKSRNGEIVSATALQTSPRN